MLATDRLLQQIPTYLRPVSFLTFWQCISHHSHIVTFQISTRISLFLWAVWKPFNKFFKIISRGWKSATRAVVCVILRRSWRDIVLLCLQWIFTVILFYSKIQVYITCRVRTGYNILIVCDSFTYIPRTHMFVTATIGCGVSHKDTKHTDKCSNNKVKTIQKQKWQNHRQVLFKNTVKMTFKKSLT